MEPVTRYPSDGAAPADPFGEWLSTFGTRNASLPVTTWSPRDWLARTATRRAEIPPPSEPKLELILTRYTYVTRSVIN